MNENCCANRPRVRRVSRIGTDGSCFWLDRRPYAGSGRFLAAFGRLSGICPRKPTFFRHLDAILPWVGLETVTCKACDLEGHRAAQPHKPQSVKSRRVAKFLIFCTACCRRTRHGHNLISAPHPMCVLLGSPSMPISQQTPPLFSRRKETASGRASRRPPCRR